VGSSGPLACGFALAHQQLRPDRVAVAFFGEGAMNQGMLMESLNLAGCWRLPVLFVCKDNGMAITTPSKRVTAGDLPDRVRGFDLPVHEVDGSDAEAVWRAAGEAIRGARRGRGPAYLHATCVRPDGHFLGDPLRRIVSSPVAELKDKVGPLVRSTVSAGGANLGQRAASLKEITAMIAKAAGMRGRDPVAKLRSRLEAPKAEIEAFEARLDGEIQAAVETALASLEEVPA
jgi:pyruvate dehydrogenase E1 component alpha subunit